MYKAAAQQGVDSEKVAKIGESFRDFPDFFEKTGFRNQKSEMQQLQVIQINSKEIGVCKANRNK